MMHAKIRRVRPKASLLRIKARREGLLAKTIEILYLCYSSLREKKGYKEAMSEMTKTILKIRHEATAVVNVAWRFAWRFVRRFLSLLSRGVAPKERAVFLLSTDKHIFATILLVFLLPHFLAFSFLFVHFLSNATSHRLRWIISSRRYVTIGDRCISPEHKERFCCRRRWKRVSSIRRSFVGQ